MTDRFKKMFSHLESKGEGAFIPFCVLGDPDKAVCLKIIRGLVEAGADALELGLPFSDPVADGPVIQQAGQRALENDFKINDGFDLIDLIRKENPDIPIGLLVYANLVEGQGRKRFFQKAAKAGVDSILIADIPFEEIEPFQEVANSEGVQIVLILPLETDDSTVRGVTEKSEGYVYLVSRAGVTGVDGGADFPEADFMEKLKAFRSAPPVLGFGISNPNQVRKALRSGCRGAITGSAIVKMIAENRQDDLFQFVREMKSATSDFQNE